MNFINRAPIRYLLAVVAAVSLAGGRAQAGNAVKEVYGTAPDGTELQWVVYTPSGTGPWPTIIVIHGGEFKAGTPDSTQTTSQDLANAGFLALSITYRLAPPGSIPGQTSDGRYPQQNDDVKMAVHAARIDPRCNGKVGAVGGSAGGYHVVYDAVTGTPGDDRVDVGISLSGAYDFSDFSPNPNIAAFTTDVLNFMGCDQSDTTALQGASPAFLATASVPPLFLVNTVDDPMPFSQLADMTNKLDSLGVKNYQAVTLPGDSHAFDYWELVKDQVIPFLTDAFAGQPYTSPTPTPTATPTPNPSATPTPNPSATPIPNPSATPPEGNAVPGRLVNVSTRAHVGTGNQVMIGGFIITGTQQKSVVLRGLGPSLANVGVNGALANPTLALYDSAGRLVAKNDDFSQLSADVIGRGLTPESNYEALISTQLVPGSYTAVLSGVGNTSGTGLLELYDLDPTSSTLSNISTRGDVVSAADPMIGGFIIDGTESAKVLVRALGPSLPDTANVLPDPTLQLRDSDGTLLYANDDWRSTQEQEIIATTIPPTNDKESAIVATLAPGSYTAIVYDASNAAGVALVEVYALPND